MVLPRRQWGIDVLWPFLAHARDKAQFATAVAYVRDAIELRRDLVLNMIARAGQRLKGKRLEEERQIVSQAWTARKDVKAFVRIDRELIPCILEHADMHVSMWLINSLADTYLNTMMLLQETLRVPNSYRDKMLATLDALERGDGPAASRILDSYLEDVEQAILEALPEGMRNVYLSKLEKLPR